ncbi:MAG: alpha/beta hydrolase, partial [Planctomycetia bacterium]|nr:alpha/beta hydrolase [Planctomycetia bacterium]
MKLPRHARSLLHRLITAALFLGATLAATNQPAAADEPAKPQPAPQTIRLWPTGAPHPDRPADAKPLDPKSPISRDEPTLTVYLPNQPASGAALVICPGGGYGGLAIDHEGHDVARYYQAHGVAGMVLKYRLPRAKVPGTAHGVPLADAQRALRLVRSKAADWHIDPAKVGILGFSAGGHLASTADTHFDRGQTDSDDPVAKFSCRPDFAVLVYPVISSDPKISHGGSFA